MRAATLVALVLVSTLGACGGAAAPGDVVDAGADTALALPDAGALADSLAPDDAVALPDAGATDAWGAALPDGRVVHGPYATRVVSFEPGAGATFGASRLPEVVLGPPVGGGDMSGGTDVVSLGRGGRICLAFDDVAIIDGPGADLLVFENPFIPSGTEHTFAELGEVSVSEDGADYRAFSCAAVGPPYPGCAGWTPVYSSPSNGISPTDPRFAGGDGFDLATVGLTRARYVCIRDLGTLDPAPPSTGFDLDAVSAVHYAPLP